jgi:hypothetical protein
MKIYIASSWKNEVEVMMLADTLRAAGHAVDCFCDSGGGRFVFSYVELVDPSKIDALEFLKIPKAKKAFVEDKKWIDWADAVVLLLPSGRSSHLEAGYAVGSGKRLFILGEFPPGEFDAMYGFAEGLFRKQDDLVKALSAGEEPGERCNREGCAGIIENKTGDESCSCHIVAPCSKCTGAHCFCPECDWNYFGGEKC